MTLPRPTPAQSSGPYTQKWAGKTIHVFAVLPDNPYGTEAANALCAEFPWLGVLAVGGGMIYLAHVDDK